MRPQQRQRVLIVDDDPWIRETLTFLLSDAGYEALTASNGMEALDTLLPSEKRMVVILDLIMPKTTGFEVLTWVVNDHHLATQHGYIVCSAKASTAEAIGPHFSALLQRLDIPFIARPFDIDVLLQVIEEVADRPLPQNAAENEKGKRGKGRAKSRKPIQQHSA